MRLFIAINFSDSTRAKLLALRDEIQLCSQRGNFCLPENLHLTLAFLGECDTKQTSALKAAIDTVAFEPIEVCIDNIGRFKRDRGDIWWAGLRKNEPLLAAHSELTDKLIASGFALDRREYKPHITLGREVVTDALPRHLEAFGEAVKCIDLMKSERVAGRLNYTAIHSIRCKS